LKHHLAGRPGGAFIGAFLRVPRRERRLSRQAARLEHPRHVAVILDARRRGPRSLGARHRYPGSRAGAVDIGELLSWCSEFDVELVTLLLLSTTELSGPQWELESRLADVSEVVDELSRSPARWRLRVVGSVGLLPPQTATDLTAAAARTQVHKGIQVNLAISYDGRWDVTHAVRKALAQEIEEGRSIEEVADNLGIEHIAQHISTSGQPPPDLIICTSGKQCLDGFLLWQAVWSEFWFWRFQDAGFRKVDFLQALCDYGSRTRRFGA
jgi:short-chain Z-isoprenyl diphosphate synthase